MLNEYCVMMNTVFCVQIFAFFVHNKPYYFATLLLKLPLEMDEHICPSF